VLSTNRLGAIRTGNVDFDMRSFVQMEWSFAVDGAVGVEELIGDVGESSSAACGDAALGDKDQEAGKKLVDVDGRVKLGELGEEVGGEIEGVAGLGGEKGTDSGTGAEVVEAKPKMGIGGVEAATLAVGEAVLTAAAGPVMALGRLVLRWNVDIDGAGVSGFGVHDFLVEGGIPPIKMD
jgi:hypothetical protein